MGEFPQNGMSGDSFVDNINARLNALNMSRPPARVPAPAPMTTSHHNHPAFANDSAVDEINARLDMLERSRPGGCVPQIESPKYVVASISLDHCDGDDVHETEHDVLHLMHDVFIQADTNGDGSIDKKELKPLMASIWTQLGQTNTTVDQVIAQCDDDHNGVLSFDEFLHLLCQAPFKDLLPKEQLEGL